MKRYLGPILLGIAAILLIIIGAVWLVTQIASVANATPAASWQTPGEQTMTLEPGEYAVSEAVGYSTFSGGGSGSGSGSDASRPTSVANSDVTVAGPMGPVLTRCANCGFGYEELTLGNEVYSAITHFDVRTTGSYTVKVTTDGADVVVNRSVSSLLSGVLPAMTPLGLGGILAIAAIIWLIILLFTKKSKPRTAGAASSYRNAGSYPNAGSQPITGPVAAAGAAAYSPQQPAVAATPDPGWYPDPNDSQAQRWWNGSDWTDETYRP
jgi:hypothetical protein